MDESATATLTRPEVAPPAATRGGRFWRTYVTDVREDADRALGHQRPYDA